MMCRCCQPCMADERELERPVAALATVSVTRRSVLQARVALAGVCDVIRTSGACGGKALGDMVIALRTTMPAPGSDEATLVVAVAAPEWNHASFAMTQAVNLIKSLRF